MINAYISRVKDNPSELLKAIVEILIVYIILKYRYRKKDDMIHLPEDVVQKLVEEFEPSDIIKDIPQKRLLMDKYDSGNIDLAGYDVFNYGCKFKKERKKILKEYGVGTCGPSNFYGTLDVHLNLETEIANKLGTEAAILYSNSFTSVISVISCFCKSKVIIFYHKDVNEAIIRGVYLSRAKSYEYTDNESLKKALDKYFDNIVLNFVIVEGLFKNTGEISNLPDLLNLKKAYNFRIILDDSFAFDMIHERGSCGYHNIDANNMDLIVGSFSYSFASNGGFCAGSFKAINYQRISSSSYVFSASLPAVFAGHNILSMQKVVNYEKLRRNIMIFHKHFEHDGMKIISNEHSPIIIIKPRSTEKSSEEDKIDHLDKMYKIKFDLLSKNIYVGINKNPYPSLRIVIKSKFSSKSIKSYAKAIKEACMKIIN